MTWLRLAIFIGVFMAGAAGGIKFHAGLTAQRDLAAQHAQAKSTARRLDRIDAAAAGLAMDKAKIRTQFVTITKEVDRLVQDPHYASLCFDDAGLRLANAAITPPAPTGQPTPALPGLTSSE